MKKSMKKRALAILMSVLMVVGLLPGELTLKDAKAADGKVYVLDASTDLTAAAAGDFTDGQEIAAGTDKYFTVYASAKMKIDSSSKTFDDGYAATQRINPSATSDVTVPKGAVGFKASAAASVKIWWVSGGDGREMAIQTADGGVVAKTSVGSTKNTLYISTLEVTDAGTYFVSVPDGSNYIFKIEVTEKAASAAPVVNEYVLDASADLTAAAAGDFTDGQEIAAGTDKFFTVYASAKMKIDSSSKTFEDGYAATQRINPSATSDVTVPKGAIGFETKGSASVKIWWVSGGDGREMAIQTADGTTVAKTSVGSTKNTLYISTLEAAEPGKYFVSVPDGSNYIFKVQVTDTVAAAPVVSEYVLDASADLTAAAAGDLTDGQEIAAGTDKFFTLYGSAKMKIDSSSKTFEDGYAATQRINPSATSDVTVPKGAIGFETKGSASVKIWWVSGGDGREMAIQTADGTTVAKTSVGSTKNTLYISTLEVAEPGKYFVSVPDGSNYIFKIQVTDTVGGGVVETPRKAWSEVAAPVLGTPALKDGAAGTIVIPYTMMIGDDGADRVEITVKNAAGEELAVLKSLIEGPSGTREFTPSSSGDYTFSIKAMREGETDKTGADVTYKGFSLPLTASSIGASYNKGNGKVALEWSAVKEAETYTIMYSLDGTTWNSVEAGNALKGEVSGLTVGKEYSFKIKANRGTDSKESEAVKVKVTADEQQKWGYIVYGNGANEKNGVLEGSVYDGKVTMAAGTFKYDEATGKWTYSGNNGKLVPASNDGLAFYYTEVPASLNFTLRAKMTVNQWILSNGQEGFGLMATDKLGGSGWNNSYMAFASKVEYYWDEEAKEVTTDNTAKKVTHKLGIGSQEKIGLTKDNISLIEGSNADAIKKYFLSTIYPLEQRYPAASNVLGNHTNTAPDNGAPVTEMYLTIQKNNTGYFVTYESVDGSYKMTKKYYDPKALEQLDSEKVYVGMFMSRYGNVSFSDITFTTIDPKNDAPAEERPIDKVAVNTSVQSSTATGDSKYEFLFNANCDGKLTIADSTGKILAKDVAVKANTSVSPLTVTLEVGKNDFVLTFTPDANYVPGEFKVMESYEAKEIKHSVTYRTYGSADQSLWVAPDANGAGTKDDPMSIYEAVKYVQSGQQIIVKEGTYKLSKTIKVERGIDGTADNMIYMVVDPDAKSRPVFDFQKMCAGMVLAGDYWYFGGFDVTNSSNAQKGMQISGSNCVVDRVNAYNNGNTGIQISRYLSTDEWADWPANNLILNCTSYNNADAGYEDADGFAAKLTVADGNVFDGCIAYNNADDGWDLFAKVQTGPIGAVTVKNSVAYRNGYMLDGTNAGNGNGFKLGGDSLSGKHVLENCIVYDNKAKGIDSNSCPDIIVKNCTSFNNESYNVAFYTNTATNTAFDATGVISFRTKSLNVTENIKPKGTQTETSDKIYNDTNYYWDGASLSANKSGVKVAEDWFVSLDTSKAPTRNADGTINMNGLLELTDKAAKDAGARFTKESSTPSTDVTIDPSVEGYKMLSADKGVVVKTKKELTFKADIPFSNFKCVWINDEVLDPAYYTAKEGSTVITLKADYVAKLKAGEYKIIIEAKDGKVASTSFTIAPDTGDSTPIALYIILALGSIAAVVGLVVFDKKRKMNN